MSESGAIFSRRQFFARLAAGGLILLNPGDDHTGEPADERGFEYRAIYPTGEHMRVRQLHAALMADAEPLACEGLFIQALTDILTRTAGLEPATLRYTGVALVGQKKAVSKIVGKLALLN